ncbi:hypothetical protein ACOSQ4_013086 [Xanthoceras sorbifolium]
MEMADNPKLDSSSSCEASGFEDKKVSISDHINGFQYSAAKKSDSFLIDMGTFSGPSKDINANSRITLQRSLSRKGIQRGAAAASSAAAAAEKKINSNTNNDRDTIVPTSSPRGGGLTEKQMAVAAVGTTTTDHSGGPQVHHHQITITTGNMTGSPESRFAMKRNSFKRSSPWAIDPKRVLLFFATLSSMGTILLIYFTLSIGKYRADQNSLY